MSGSKLELGHYFHKEFSVHEPGSFFLIEQGLMMGSLQKWPSIYKKGEVVGVYGADDKKRQGVRILDSSNINLQTMHTIPRALGGMLLESHFIKALESHTPYTSADQDDGPDDDTDDIPPWDRANFGYTIFLAESLFQNLPEIVRKRLLEESLLTNIRHPVTQPVFIPTLMAAHMRHDRAAWEWASFMKHYCLLTRREIEFASEYYYREWQRIKKIVELSKRPMSSQPSVNNSTRKSWHMNALVEKLIEKIDF
jgi:hypothetical protein